MYTLHSAVTPLDVSVGAFSVGAFTVMCIDVAVGWPVEFSVTRATPSSNLLTLQRADETSLSACLPSVQYPSAEQNTSLAHPALALTTLLPVLCASTEE